jgi:hypothetical protein
MLALGRPLVALVMTDPPLEAVQLVMVITPLLILLMRFYNKLPIALIAPAIHTH